MAGEPGVGESPDRIEVPGSAKGSRSRCGVPRATPGRVGGGEDLESRSFFVVCGNGGNGGDGLVVLGTLVCLGYDARAVVLAPFESLSAEALDNLQAALKLGRPGGSG